MFFSHGPCRKQKTFKDGSPEKVRLYAFFRWLTESTVSSIPDLLGKPEML